MFNDFCYNKNELIVHFKLLIHLKKKYHILCSNLNTNKINIFIGWIKMKNGKNY